MALEHRHLLGARTMREREDADGASGAKIEARLHLEILVREEPDLDEHRRRARGRGVERSVDGIDAEDLEATRGERGSKRSAKLRIPMREKDDGHALRAGYFPPPGGYCQGDDACITYEASWPIWGVSTSASSAPRSSTI